MAHSAPSSSSSGATSAAPRAAYDWDKDREAGLEREKRATEDFIRANPFPSFPEMLLRIEKATRVNPFYESILRGYKEEHHGALAKCYANFMDEAFCRRQGEIINAAGGWDAMSNSCTVFRYLSPLASSDDIGVRGYVIALDGYWNGVGDFKL